jgi:putative membrane protein
VENFKAKHLTHEQVLRITQAVMQAETQTQGEIVPMIVSRSSTVGHVPFHLSVMLLSLILVFAVEIEPWWFFEFKWESILISVLLSALLGWMLSRLDFVQRWMIPFDDQESQVWQKAQSEWAKNKIQKTKARTGILIFVSIMERKAVVLADEGIAKHYPQETWIEVVELLSSHLKKNEWGLGFEKAIARCGEILKKHLPAGAHNKNEISDEIIIKS